MSSTIEMCLASSSAAINHNEVDELLDHLSSHPNTPIYIAARLIQQFGMSTPPASYMLAVGGAFKSDTFEGFGKGNKVALQRLRLHLNWQTMPLSQDNNQSPMEVCASLC